MKKNHILIIEDQKDQIKIFEHIIKKMTKNLDCHIFSTTNGKDALELIHGNKKIFDFPLEKLGLIITDLFLPDVSGLQILEEAKKAKSPIPVIIFSTDSDAELIVKAVKLGAEDFIVKSKEGESDRLFNSIKRMINTGLD